MLSVFRKKKTEVEIKKPKEKKFRDEPFLKKEFFAAKPIKSIKNVHLHDVKTHKDGGWQIIEVGKERAKKRTQSQATAIKYCVKNNLNFREFNKNGTLREEEWKKELLEY